LLIHICSTTSIDIVDSWKLAGIKKTLPGSFYTMLVSWINAVVLFLSKDDWIYGFPAF
jgi:hypothetical protein